MERSGQKRSSRYCVLQRASRNSNGKEPLFSPKSRTAVDRVHRPLSQRSPVSYDSNWLESYTPNKSWHLPSDIRTRLTKAGQRYTYEVPAGTFAHQVYNRLLIDLSFNSSRLEGNTYSLLDTQRLLLEGTKAQDKLEEETVMILNHKEAIRFLVDNAPKQEVTPQTIYTLHYLLSDGLLDPNEVGRTRAHGVRIGGSTYIPLENQKRIESLLERIAEKASLIEDPFEKSFFLLVHITYCRPLPTLTKERLG